MKKTVASLMILGVIGGCSAMSSEPSPATNLPSATEQPAAKIAAPEAKHFQLKHTTLLPAETLPPATPVGPLTLLESQPADDFKVLTYHKKDKDEGIYAVIQTTDGTYDLGQIGYEGDGSLSADTVDVLGQSYMKVTGSIGANAPVSHYVSLHTSPPETLHIEAHTMEADVNQDGLKEIIATVGTAAETSIYKRENDSLVSVNLNAVLDAAVVTYDQATNTFHAELTEGKKSSWKIKDNLLIQSE